MKDDCKILVAFCNLFTRLERSKLYSLSSYLGIACLLVLFYILASLLTATEKSAHFDEPAHLMSGYFMLNKNDYRLGTSNMVLAQKLAAIPISSSKMPPETEKLAQKFLNMPFIHGEETFILGLSFLKSDNAKRSSEILFHPRCIMVCLGILLAISVFLYSAKLFGIKGGLISLAFLSTCPSMISLSGIVGTEMTCALFFFLSAWSFWALLHRLNLLTLSAFCASFSCLVATKMSSLAFFPYAGLALIFRIYRGHPLNIGLFSAKKCEIRGRRKIFALLCASFVIAGAIVSIGIWSLYGFRYSAEPALTPYSAQLNWDRILCGDAFFVQVLKVAKDARLFPEAFLYDFASLRNLTASCPAFFMGETSRNGWTMYFPTLFVAKTNFSLLIAFLISIAIFAYSLFYPHQEKKNEMKPDAYEIAPILIFITVFMSVAMSSRMNIGHRHIFPIYPFVYVLTGYIAVLLEKKRTLPKIFVFAVVFSSFASAIATYPNYLSYVSPVFGGPDKAYKNFVDSNIDWGQELPAMKKWLEKNNKSFLNVKAYFSYFGSDSPESYGIHLERLHGYLDPRMQDKAETSIGKRLQPGAYFISATMLQPVYYFRENIFFQTCDFSGGWSSKHQKKYEEMKKVAEPLIEALETAKKNPEKKEALETWFKNNKPESVAEAQARQFWLEFLAGYDLARFAKLAKHLRNKEPDANINNSIYLFILNENDLHNALN